MTDPMSIQRHHALALFAAVEDARNERGGAGQTVQDEPLSAEEEARYQAEAAGMYAAMIGLDLPREDSEPSLVEEFESTTRGALEMAAAAFADDVMITLNAALEASGLQKQELADAALVTPGRVSQVLGDGNLRTSTVAKFCRAMGYAPRLRLEPLEPGRATICSHTAHEAEEST